MPTRPTSPDPSGAAQADQTNPFATLGAGLGAGLDFFQDWLKAAGSALPNMSGSQATGATPGMPGMPAWSMPTLDPAELEKRIQELKTVQFWLEQNARMIGMTIQGLEVQRMTLSTLKGMNVSMDALRDSLKARAQASGTPDAASLRPAADTPADDAQPSGATPAGANTDANELINPMRWWDTLTQQFTHLASQAAQSVNESVGESMDRLKQAQADADGGAPASRKTRGAAARAGAARNPDAADARPDKAATKPAAKSGGKHPPGRPNEP